MSYSGTAFSWIYFLVQSAGFTGWWLLLWLRPGSRSAFLPPGAAEIDLMAFVLPDLGVAVAGSIAAAVAILSRARWSLPLAWFTAGAVVYAAGYCIAWAVLRNGGWLSVMLMTPAALLSTVAAVDISTGVIRVFRQAAPASSSRHVVVTLIQIAVIWSFFLYVVPKAIVYIEGQLGISAWSFPSQKLIAALLFLLFSGLGLTTGLTMARHGAGTPLPLDAPNRLVVKGPYAYFRNPMAVAGLGQGTAVGLGFGSFTVLAYVLLGGLIWQFLVRPAEEADLLKLFTDEYRSYRREVRCWVPRLRPYRPRQTELDDNGRP